ncbi:stage IV sporulation protein A [Anaeropeptidivorans aminofermentans]|uniref:stage IV sporulation protein A n=1 Tax=Anaeropeptidivorans aminofermentans TaxID=2934315 RepID=UPI00202485CA|nr:stage IV sporulation protein A [Anaeropeptidivorans aminofermentans]MBE6013418.1 stage IV sporulation protein A [Lachnospiraceae bacterium]
MDNFNIYKDISERTNGDIYIGVVGPVRTGKSTFIKRFMDELVIPNIESGYTRERAKDELPQSATGRGIMTTEPKFIPNEAIELTLDENIKFKMRMIDCVGYLVPGATGYQDGEGQRMVNTPWSEDKIPFSQAAEIGTKKVINDHSTIGIVITTDGSITEIERKDYIEAEERVISELKKINKPFVIVLNTTKPYSPETETLRAELSEKYKVPVMPVNCAQMKSEDISAIMEKILYEFPIQEIKIHLPKWIETLELEHWLKQSIINAIKGILEDITKLRSIKDNMLLMEDNEYIKKVYIDGISLGDGSADIEISVDDDLFYRILSETTRMDINSDYQLISTIKVLSDAKREYDKVKYALEEVRQKGYGIVTPALEEMKLEEPNLVKHGSKYGVKIKASAPSIHLIRADIETEISPIVGTEQQSQDLINFIMDQMEEGSDKVWEMNMFGRNMHDLVKDGLQSKLYHMPESAQVKFQETLQRIINEGRGGLICIIL